jgi:hypothetical protein
MPINVPVLCIPRVFSNIDEKRIRRVFDELNMGEILRIDVISKTTDKGEKFNRVFVHFKRWFANSNSDMARERLLNGKEIKIIYDEPWFWKVSAYRETNKPAPVRPPTAVKKISLQFDSDDEDHQPKTQRPQRSDSRPQRSDSRQQRPDSRRQNYNRKEEKDSYYFPQSPKYPPPPPASLNSEEEGEEKEEEEKEEEKESFEEPQSVDYGEVKFPRKRRFTLVNPAEL